MSKNLEFYQEKAFGGSKVSKEAEVGQGSRFLR